jgi:hypothetical protein
LQHTPM